MTRRVSCIAALAATCLAWLSAPALAGCGPDNPNCIVPTRPLGDSTNAAASTAFVQANAAPGPYATTPEKFGALGNGVLLFDGVTYGSNITTGAAANAAAVTTATTTTTQANDLIVTAINNYNTYSAGPSYSSSRLNYEPSGGYRIAIGDTLQTSPGVTTAVTATQSAQAYWESLTIPLAPAVGNAISFVGATSGGVASGGATSVTVSTPAGVAAGDFLLACAAYTNDNNSSATPLATPPGGAWNYIAAKNTVGVEILCYSHFATASEPASYTFQAITPQANALTIGIVDYRGVGGVDSQSSKFTSASASFAQADVGKLFCSQSGPTILAKQSQQCGTIASVASANQVNLSFPIETTQSSTQFAYGSDDRPAFVSMLTSAPCSTIGCAVALGNKKYALSNTISLPSFVPSSLTGTGYGVTNTVARYTVGPIANNAGGTRLMFLTTGMTGPGVAIEGTLGHTGDTGTAQLSNLTLQGGVGDGMDGGGGDGVDILDRQGVFLRSVAMFNFTKVGMYIDALQVGSDDYIVNVGCYGCYISMNGTNGVQIGSAAASQTNLEGISINNSQIEGNGSQGILFNGYIINGFSAIGNVIQWNNIQSIYANYYELYSSASGVIAGGTITGNYFEMDTVFGSNDVGAINASSNWADVSFGSNYFLPNNLNAKQLYSAAGIAVPACNSGAYVWHQTLTVSDATACTRGTTYTSGGSTQCDISCSGTNWIESGAATY